MESCANCDACWGVPTGSYGCLKGKRPNINDLFVLGRVRCDTYNQVDILLTEQNKIKKPKK